MRVSTFQNANWAKNQLMDLNAAAISSKSSNFREEKPSYE